MVRLEAGDRTTDLCLEYGISRKTGYKFWDRYKELGPEGLFDVSRRPLHSPRRWTGDLHGPEESAAVCSRSSQPTVAVVPARTAAASRNFRTRLGRPRIDRESPPSYGPTVLESHGAA